MSSPFYSRKRSFSAAHIESGRRNEAPIRMTRARRLAAKRREDLQVRFEDKEPTRSDACRTELPKSNQPSEVLEASDGDDSSSGRSESSETGPTSQGRADGEIEAETSEQEPIEDTNEDSDSDEDTSEDRNPEEMSSRDHQRHDAGEEDSEGPLSEEEHQLTDSSEEEGSDGESSDDEGSQQDTAEENEKDNNRTEGPQSGGEAFSDRDIETGESRDDQEEPRVQRAMVTEVLLRSVKQAHDRDARAISVARGEVIEDDPSEKADAKNRRRQSSAMSRRETQKERNVGGTIEDMQINWAEMLERIEPGLFEGDLALMKKPEFQREEMSGGRSLYKGLPVFPMNNSDLNYIYRVGYSARTSRQCPTTGTFAQFRSTFGQLCRFLISLKAVQSSSLYKEGAVFDSISHDVLDAFLRFFVLHAAPSTSTQKAMHCSIICQHAIRFYHARGCQRTAARVEEIREFVRGVHSTAKSEARIVAGHRSLEARAEEKKILSAEDMELLRDSAMHSLNSMVAFFGDIERAEGENKVIEYLKTKPKVVSKVSIDLMAALVMTGSGQRPQVYSKLLLPTASEMQKWTRHVTIKVAREKTQRMRSYVIFPRRIKQALISYLTFVRPAIVQLHRVPAQEKCLILHTRTGEPITPDSVRATFRSFATSIDRQYDSITPMCVRSSFATTMLTNYRNGDFGTEKTEAKFLSELAITMNTSPEMLHSTYIAISDKSYVESVQYLSEHMN